MKEREQEWKKAKERGSVWKVLFAGDAAADVGWDKKTTAVDSES